VVSICRAVSRHPLPQSESSLDLSAQLAKCPGTTACGLELSNYSKFPLRKHQVFLQSGEVLLDIGNIKPGYRGAGVFQGEAQSEGCSGVMAWNIGDTDKILVVLWNIPTNGEDVEDLENTAAIGLMAEGDVSKLFSFMLKVEGSDFVRKAFTKDDTEKLKLEGENYFVTAKMGTGNACVIFMFNNLSIPQKTKPGCRSHSTLSRWKKLQGN
jgi:hypothetical protein